MNYEIFTQVLNVLRGIVCFAGVTGNLMVIFVIIALREYHQAVTHWYVLQLAVADLFFLLTLPFKMEEDLRGKWILSNGLCKAKETMLFISYYSSVLFLTVMSVDRLIAVCCRFSLKLQKLRSKPAASVITLFIWIACLVLCTPIMLYSGRRGCSCQNLFPSENNNITFPGLNESDLAENDCEQMLQSLSGDDVMNYIDYEMINYSGNDDYEPTLTTNSEKFQEWNSSETIYEMGCSYALSGIGYAEYLLFNFIFTFAIPCIVMSTSYCLIVTRLKRGRYFLRASSKLSGNSDAPNRGQRKRFKSVAFIKAEKNRVQVTLVCLLLAISFVICWLPFHVIHLAKMNGIKGSVEYCKQLASITSLAAYLNSALNPYIYNFIGRKFGNRFRSALGSVPSSIKRRASSLSFNEVAFAYKTGKRIGSPTLTNSATVITKFDWKRKSKAESSYCHSSSKDQEEK